MQLGKAALTVCQIIIHRHLKALLPGLHLAQQLLLIAADHLRRCRRRWRAQIGDKIGDRHVSFMADGADHRNAAGKNRPRHAFVVKAPQIFQRPAAAPDDQHVALAACVRQFNGAHNLPRRIVALDGGGVNHHRQRRIATFQYVKDIVQRRAGFRGDHPDAVSRRGQRLFEFLAEQSFRLKLSF